MALLGPSYVFFSPWPMKILLLTTLPRPGAILKTFVCLQGWCQGEHHVPSKPEVGAVKLTQQMPALGWDFCKYGTRYTPADDGNPSPNYEQ